MRTFHISSTAQISVVMVSMALLFTLISVSITQHFENRDLPLVQYNQDGTCYNVLNYRNGDAYNCEDLNFLLRKFKSEQISPADIPIEIIPEMEPEVISKPNKKSKNSNKKAKKKS